jgi:hypothetical protein
VPAICSATPGCASSSAWATATRATTVSIWNTTSSPPRARTFSISRAVAAEGAARPSDVPPVLAGECEGAAPRRRD